MSFEIKGKWLWNTNCQAAILVKDAKRALELMAWLKKEKLGEEANVYLEVPCKVDRGAGDGDIVENRAAVTIRSDNWITIGCNDFTDDAITEVRKLLKNGAKKAPKKKAT